MTNRFNCTTKLTHAERSYPLSLFIEGVESDNAVIVTWQNKAASPNAVRAALAEGASEVGIITFNHPIEGWPKLPVLWFLVQGEPKLAMHRSDSMLSFERGAILLAALYNFLHQERLRPFPAETPH